MTYNKYIFLLFVQRIDLGMRAGLNIIYSSVEYFSIYSLK